MKRVLLILSLIALLTGAYWIGYFRAELKEGNRQMMQNFEHWQQLAKLDRTFLTNIVTRSSSLTTGTYVLETQFPDDPPQTNILSLTFLNGQFALPKSAKPGRLGMADTLVQDGNVVAWRDEGILYEADAEWVGLIDGNSVWGRVYGWNPGKESIGVWRLFPAPPGFQANKPVEPTRAPADAHGSP